MIYLAGADPYEGDRLGRLKMTARGLEERDRKVFGAALERGVPVAVAMAGGYGRIIEETCAVHAQTVAVAAEFADRYVAAHVANSDARPCPFPRASGRVGAEAKRSRFCGKPCRNSRLRRWSGDNMPGMSCTITARNFQLHP